MIRLLLTILSLSTIAAVAAFDEEGISKKNCDSAKKDAQFLAKSTCLSLGAEDSKKERFSKCKNVDGKHLVTISYSCELPQDDVTEGYDPDYSESENTSLHL